MSRWASSKIQLRIVDVNLKISQFRMLFAKVKGSNYIFQIKVESTYVYTSQYLFFFFSREYPKTLLTTQKMLMAS